MNRALYAALGIALSLCAATTLSACTAGSGGGPSSASSTASVPAGPAWNGAPTGPAARVTLGKGNVHRLDISKWTVNNASGTKDGATFKLTPATSHSPAMFSLTGTDSAVAQEIFSPAIRVVPGRTYTFSGIVDASKVSTGSNYLWISNAGRNKLYGSAQVSAGQSGRFGLQAHLPDGVHEVRVGLYTGGSSVRRGGNLTFADPALAESPR